jgi:hypothetical protein
MIKAVRTPETPVNLYQSTLHYNPEDSHLQHTNIPLASVWVRFLENGTLDEYILHKNTELMG